MSEWISVEDRLPDELESVLVSRNGNVCNMFLHGGIWKPDGYGIRVTHAFDDVTHWMPLPEPPSDTE